MSDERATPGEHAEVDGEQTDEPAESADERTDGAPGTVCPFCSVGCRLDRRDGRVRGREGPANPEGRLCRQGLRAFDGLDAADRFTEPMVREGGDLVAVPWDEALDRAVAGFERVREARGPDALAFLGAPQCTNEENYLLGKLARTLGTNNVDNRARRCHAATTRALAERLGWPAATAGLPSLCEADLFLVVGANPAARQPVAFDSFVRPTVNDGAALVHVDPHANETTRLADVHLAPRPGTDALLVTLLSALVVAAGDVDRAFVDERATGYDAFRESLAAYGASGGDGTASDQAAPAVAAGAATADVPVEKLRRVARLVGAADGVVVMTGTGVDERATADALVNLCLLTGNLGKPGTGIYPLRGLANEQGAADVGCVPDRLPGHQPVSDDAARACLAAAWGESVPATPGKSEDDLLSAFGDGIGAALVVGENPAVSKRDPEAVARGLDALDTLVVQELAPSETTAHADVVLPAAAGVEKEGTVTNLDRQVQRRRRLADPPDGVRTDFEILRELGRRLVGPGFAPSTPRATFAELTRVTPVYEGLSCDGLGERGRRWPVRGEASGADGASPTGEASGADGASEAGGTSETGEHGVLYADGFEAGDGRAPFVAVDPSPPAETGDGLRLVVVDRAGGFGTGGDDERTTTRPDRRVTVHPVDAGERDIQDGDPVTVATDAASVETTARVTEAVRPGTVALHASVADPLVRGDDGTVRLDGR